MTRDDVHLAPAIGKRESSATLGGLLRTARSAAILGGREPAQSRSRFPPSPALRYLPGRRSRWDRALEYRSDTPAWRSRVACHHYHWSTAGRDRTMPSICSAIASLRSSPALHPAASASISSRVRGRKCAVSSRTLVAVQRRGSVPLPLTRPRRIKRACHLHGNCVRGRGRWCHHG